MAQSGQTVTNPVAGMTLLFVKTAADTDGELLEMEATYGPASVPPPSHFHPNQAERFEILEGTMHARIDGAERELTAGDLLDIETGVVHSMWNEGPDPARVLWQTRPALRTEDFFEQMAAVFSEAHEQGRDPDGARLGEIIQGHSDEFQIATED